VPFFWKKSKPPDVTHRSPSPAPPPWIQSPNNIEMYPHEAQKKDLRRIVSQLETALAREAATLDHLSIPKPIQNTGVIFKPGRLLPDHVEMRLDFPTFTLPPHMVFPIIQTREKLAPTLTYALFGNDQAIRQATVDVKRKGLAYVSAHYRGYWLNRHPYALYHYVRSLRDIEWIEDYSRAKTKIANYKQSTPYLEDFELPPLQAAHPPFSLAEVQAIEQRAHLISNLHYPFLDNCPEPSQLFLQPLPQTISEELIFQIPVPSSTFPPDIISRKILPAAETKSRSLRPFLDRIRGAQSPISFEIIKERKTVNFQLTFARRDQELIERQLKNICPNVDTLTQSPNPHATKSSHVLCASPRSYGLFKTADNFDPYSSLYSILSDAAPDDYACVQVLFAAFKSKSLLRLMASLMVHWKADKERYKTPDKIAPGTISKLQAYEKRYKELEKKQPSWLLGVRLFSSNLELLEKIQRVFMGQYETLEQKWEWSKVETAQDIKGKPFQWNISNTEELAALVRLP